jgi:hypothetical protein
MPQCAPGAGTRRDGATGNVTGTGQPAAGRTRRRHGPAPHRPARRRGTRIAADGQRRRAAGAEPDRYLVHRAAVGRGAGRDRGRAVAIAAADRAGRRHHLRHPDHRLPERGRRTPARRVQGGVDQFLGPARRHASLPGGRLRRRLGARPLPARCGPGEPGPRLLGTAPARRADRSDDGRGAGLLQRDRTAALHARRGEPGGVGERGAELHTHLPPRPRPRRRRLGDQRRAADRTGGRARSSWVHRSGSTTTRTSRGSCAPPPSARRSASACPWA